MMNNLTFPVIDPAATGRNIIRLRKEKGLTVRDMQSYFGFEEPQAIYKWQNGKSLPSVDNLYALGALLSVPMEDILVPVNTQSNIVKLGQQECSCCPEHFVLSNLTAVLDAEKSRFEMTNFDFFSHRKLRKAVFLLYLKSF